MSLGSGQSGQTLGAFIDERYAPWARENVGDDAAARLKADFADWLAEPLARLSAWRIESWRRDQLDAVAPPLTVSRQLQALDTCLSKAVEWQLIERNPLKDVSLEADADYFIELFGGGVGHGCLREGWARIGVNWTWTLGKRAVLELPPIGGQADYGLKIVLAGVTKKIPQRLVVTLNDARVGMVLCRGPATYEFFVPGAALRSRDRIDVVLEIPDACRPMDQVTSDPEESGDKRLLGLRVAKIEFRPMVKSEQKKQLPSPAEDSAGVLEQRAALHDMVSLGCNCEFGFAQRHLGAEPMSLFRWANVPIGSLIAGLEKRFAGLNARDALDAQVTPEGEFAVTDKVYGFRRHTFVFAQAGLRERVLRSEYIRVGVLCKTLLKELRENSKLFVFHDRDVSKLEGIRRLVSALRSYGDNTLLWIVGASGEGEVGEVRPLERGLIQGFVSGFQTFPIGPDSPHLPSWIKVAYGAHQMWKRTKDSPDPSRVEKGPASTPKQ